MKSFNFIILFSIIVQFRMAVKTYKMNFDDDDIWKYLYKPEYAVRIDPHLKTSSISPEKLENDFIQRDFDNIMNLISVVKGPGECYPVFQNVLTDPAEAEVQNIKFIKNGTSGDVYQFNQNALKIISENKIGAENLLPEFASHERNMKYYLREINTGRIILMSYLTEGNVLSNLNVILDSCIEKTIITSKRDATMLSFKFFLLMPLFPASLRDILSDGNEKFHNDSFLLDWKLNLLDGILLGIYWIHHNGYSHRDLKPSNILISDNGVPFISDFGFAKEFSTNTSSVVGSPVYMAPELKDEEVSYTHIVDVYSLGVLLFEVLNCKSRIDINSYNRQMILNYCQSNQFPLLSVEKAEFDIYCKYYSGLVNHMLERDPLKRINMISVIRQWINHREKAEEQGKLFEKEVFDIGSQFAESQLNENFLVEIEKDINLQKNSNSSQQINSQIESHQLVSDPMFTGKAQNSQQVSIKDDYNSILDQMENLTLNQSKLSKSNSFSMFISNQASNEPKQINIVQSSNANPQYSFIYLASNDPSFSTKFHELFEIIKNQQISGDSNGMRLII